MILLLPSWTYVALLVFVASGFAHEKNCAVIEERGRGIFRNKSCLYDQFPCSDGECIRRNQFCDGRYDCEDRSDETYCRTRDCPETPLYMSCDSDRNFHDSYQKCIPASWRCDDHIDCKNGIDEMNCLFVENAFSLFRIEVAKQRTLRWILQGRNDQSLSNKWGEQVARKAVAWYLGDQNSFVVNKTFVSEMAYEVSLGLLARIADKKSLTAVSSMELATYLNSFLVTCVNPRRFYDMDLVSELRARADASNKTHPSVTLALCNAGDDISDRDVAKTINAFWNAHKNFRTDVATLAVLALSCAVRQDRRVVEASQIAELTIELKKKQYGNGTVETLKTTALVMQALYASEREADEDNFDEKMALKQILRSQKKDGSFGNTANTYYVLPVLAYRSLINISSSHCTPHHREEDDRLEDLLNLVGQKSSIRYSLWIGNNKTLKKTIILKVPANISFYGVMEWAAGVDSQFRFEYSMRDRKPYIYSISGVQEDPENDMFWFLHSIDSGEEEKATPTEQSPVDVVPMDGQHLVFWYKCD